MRITKSIKRFEQVFDKKAERFLCCHPVLGFLAIFIGVPMFVLAGVCICTVVVAFPLAWIFGWL